MQKLAQGLTQREQDFFKAYAKLFDDFKDLEGTFGLWRVHSHFPLSANEALYEASEKSGRFSIIQPKLYSEIPAHAFVSQWQVTSKEIIPSLWCCD